MRTVQLLGWLTVAIFGLTFAVSRLAVAADDGFVMTPIEPNNDASPQVLHGKPAIPTEWPGTLKFQSSGGFCTATITGERSIITAAHCIDEKNPVGRVLFNNAWVKVTCQNHEKYRGSDCSHATGPSQIFGCTADVSLCVAASQLQLPGLKYETVNKDRDSVKPAAPIVLVGYGCVVAGGPISEDLQVGETTVQATSQPGVSLKDKSRSLEEYVRTEGGSALCQGDSGGAAYSSEALNTRRFVGINSRGNISTTSYLVNVSDPDIQGFLDSQGKKFGISICGVHTEAANCR